MSFRHLLGLSDRVRYFGWRLTGRRKEICLTLGCETKAILRPGREDYGVVYETFILKSYKTHLASVRRIVDVGAHCGFATLYFAKEHPSAQILSFEPDPDRAERLREHISLNGLQPRTEVYEAAVGTDDTTVFLSEDGSSSKLAAEGKAVQALDFFSAVGAEPIDVLKLDVEGSEYALLADPRFDRLRIRCVMMEWHRTPEHPDGRDWCSRRLAALGYSVTHLQEFPGAGILHAYHR